LPRLEQSDVVEELLRQVRRLVPAAVVAMAVLAPSPVRGDAVTFCDRDDRVGPGSLEAALAAGRGGPVSRHVPATMQMTMTHRLVRSVTVDGGDASRITLDGGGRTLSMFVIAAPNVSLSLTGLTVRRAIARPLGHLDPHIHGSVVDAGLQS